MDDVREGLEPAYLEVIRQVVQATTWGAIEMDVVLSRAAGGRVRSRGLVGRRRLCVQVVDVGVLSGRAGILCGARHSCALLLVASIGFWRSRASRATSR